MRNLRTPSTPKTTSTRLLTALVAIIIVTSIVTATAYMQQDGRAQEDTQPASRLEKKIATGSKDGIDKIGAAIPQESSLSPQGPQATSNYSFSTATNASLSDMSSGTTSLVAADQDDTASSVFNIGFDFYFQGVRYTQFSANSNGLMRLGSTTVQGGSPYKPLAQASIPLITPYGADQRTLASTGKVHFKTTGAAPNRVLIVEWLNMQSNFNTGGTSDLTYQARLYETTGVIEYVYGKATMSAAGAADANSKDPNIGFSSSNTAGTVGSVTAAQSGTPAPTFDGSSAIAVANTYTAGTITVLDSATNGSRRIFTFTPPTPTAPTNLTFTGVTSSAMTLNWTDSANETLYAIYNSTDGTNYTFVNTAAQNATSFNATGLTLNTTYFWRVFAVSEGALSSSPLAGSQATAAAGNITSTTTGGLWSATTTWTGGVVPTASDNVTIANSATVTIDTAASALSLTVGQGTSGILQFEATTARTLTVAGNVTIASGGTFQTATTGTQTGHVLSVGGNLTNNGTLDFSTNTNTAGASITFTGASNNTFGGTGATTDVRTITINKGTSSANILELNTTAFTVQGSTSTTTTGNFVTLTNGTLKISGTFTGTHRTFVTTGTATYVNATSGIWLNNPNYTISGQTGSPTIAGLLRLTQGTYNVGTATGNSMDGSAGAVFIIEGGTLNTTGRFSPQSAVSYTQSAGAVNVCTVGQTSNSFGCFELFSTSSTFTMSGGTINLVQASTAATTPIDFDVLSSTVNYTGGTLNIGTAATATNFNFRINGNTPAIVIDNTTNNKTATIRAQTVVFGDITVSTGTTLNLNGFLFALLRNLTNNGTISGNTASSRLYFAGSTAQTYSGSGTAGTVALPLQAVDFDSTGGVTFNAATTNNLITNTIRIFTGNVTNSNKLTLGIGGTSTGTIQIGNTTTATNAGSFDVQPTFNLGSGGEVISYLRTTNARTTGNEVNPTRTLFSMTYDDNDATHALTIAGGDLTLSSTATALTLTTGRIVTNSNNLILSSGTATVTRTSGYVDGNLRKNFTATGSKTFEVGTANGYSPVAANVTAGTGNFTAKATQTKQPNISGANALSRYWTLTATGLTADLTFNYLAGDVVGTEANYKIFKYNGSFTQFNPSTLNTATHVATLNGVNSFSDWTLAEATAVQAGSLQFSSATYSVSENGSSINVPVTRTGGTDGAVSVSYATSNGTATAGSDYTGTSGTLNWTAGDAANKTINIPILQDTSGEGDETFNVTLSAPTGNAAIGTPNPATVTITDDDMDFNSSGNLPAGTYDNITLNNCATVVTMTGNVTVTGSLVINNCATLNTNGFIVSGTGSFALNAGGTLDITDPAGITLSPTLAGSIQVTGTRSRSTLANYVYNGTAAQVTGDGLPFSVANLTLDNPTSVTASGPGQIVSGLLEVKQGTYNSASTYNNVQIDNAGTFVPSLNETVNVTGDWTNNGTFTANGSTVNFNKGAGQTQLVSGSSVTTFFDVSTSNGVNFGSGATRAVINGTFTLNTNGFVPSSPNYGAASTLVYNTGGNYGRNGEWLPGATSGAGYPNNVQLSNNTTLDLPNSSTTQPFQMGGTLTIDSGSTMSMSPLTQPLTVLGSVNINGTLSLSTSSGGDIKLGGDWNRNSATGTFTPNGRAVFFNGTTTQTITVNPAGTETFNYLIVDKSAGTLKLNNSPATQVNVNATVGNVLQLINAGGIDLAGNTLTLQNNGGSILVSGGVRTISDVNNFAGRVHFDGSKSVVSSGGGTLSVTDNVVVQLQASVDFGSLVTTVNNQFIMLGANAAVNTNPPTYTSNSTLVYDYGVLGFKARGPEWSATSGPGYPNNVQIKATSSIDLGAGGPSTARQIAKDLLINSGGELSLAATPMTAALTVLGNVTISSGGVLTLSTAIGGDLKLQGNYSNSGLFMHNNRAVFFEGANTQTLTDASGTAAMPYVIVNKGGGTVQLNSNLTTNGPGGGNSISFSTAMSTLTLNGKTLTLGSTLGSTPAGAGFIGDNLAAMVLQDGGTPGPMGTLTFVTGANNLQSLTLNRTGATGSVTLGSALNINGGTNALTLTAGILDTGANTLKMGDDATSTGAHNGTDASYVVGTMTKVYSTVPKDFTFDLGTTGGTTPGHTPASVNAQVTSATGEVTATVTNAHHPTLSGSSLNRYWSLSNNGLTLANLAFNYLDGDLPASPPEAALVTYKIDGPTAMTPPGSAVNPVNNQITVAGATSFSDWTAGAIDAPTAVKMVSFEAHAGEGGVLVRWQTGREVDNLGFNLIREDGGRRTRVTPSIVAGSALLAGPQTTLTAGQSYSWWDAKGRADSRYYLEDIDLGGKRTLHGPVSPGAGKGRLEAVNQSTLLSELRPANGAIAAPTTQGRPSTLNAQLDAAANGKQAAAVDSGPLAQQRLIASGQAIKLQVKHNGWYQVNAFALIAAGLDPQAEQSTLQLYADGIEVPILIRSDNDRTLGQTGAIEFYGQGLDTPTSDARTYWLIAGTQPGKRIGPAEGVSSSPERTVSRVDGNSLGGPQSFAYTVERKDRVVFFAALHNGDAQNFFGPVISTTAVAQTLDVPQPAADATATATLEVALQGGTIEAHQVRVKFNGQDLGVVSFNGQDHMLTRLSVPQGSLVEGQNTVTLAAEGGDTDVSVVDYIRLTYARRYVAENDSLVFSMGGRSAVTVGGFTRPQVNVFDITDPNNVTAVEGKVASQGAGFAVKVQGSGAARTLIALTDDRAELVADVTANQPSTLTGSNQPGADLVIITHGAFKGSVEPLAQLRRNQGLQVAVVDVEDVYDEFSYGAHSTEAVKDFLAWTSTNWQLAPHYVLLVGDASLDPRNYLGYGNQDYVPTRMVDSAFLETASDDALADFNNDGLAEMAVGRLPVRTVGQADTVVGKITGYVPGISAQGALLVSDHNEGYNFEGVNQQVQSLLPAGMPVTVVNRGDNPAEQVRSQIISGINQGPQIVNFVGHGSVEVWTGAGLLSSADAASLTNGNRLPLFISMTCLNGYFHDLSTESLAEALVKAPNGGAVAAWASSGLTEPGAQSAMDRQLVQLLFGSADSPMLGDAVRNAKTATENKDVRRTWILFGDPTMRLR